MHPQLDNRIRSRLRLRHLELLDALGETNNVHQAAPRLHLSQSATSKLLQELEQLYRTRLFERHARGLAPTAAGQTAIRWARRLLYETGESFVETQLVAKGASGRIRLGALAVAVPTLYQRVLSRVQTDLPQLVVSVVEAPLDSLIAGLQRRELDLVFARLTPETRQPGLISEPLYEESVSLVVQRDHALLTRRRLALKDLVEEEWVLPPGVAPMRQQLDEAFDSAGLPRPKARIETISLLLVETILSHTRLVGLMPTSVAKQYQLQGRIKRLKLDLPIAQAPVGLVRGEAVNGPALESFLNLVRGSMRELLETAPAA